jgi:hypothetical protein
MAHPHDHEQRIRRARLSLDGLFLTIDRVYPKLAGTPSF